jgi:hypothetical protein
MTVMAAAVTATERNRFTLPPGSRRAIASTVAGHPPLVPPGAPAPGDVRAHRAVLVHADLVGVARGRG